jgi:predicted adenylyl cyclase CyaB
MAVNIEIKARVQNFLQIKAKIEQLSDTACQVISQEDTFFNCPDGRLKLRELSAEHGQLVYYHRSDVPGPKPSDYQIYHTADPAGLKDILSRAFGVCGVVSKVRNLYMLGQTRIHLDEVKGLGKFIELEVVLQPSQTVTDGQAIATTLMHQLGIQEADLVGCAYMDMLEK